MVRVCLSHHKIHVQEFGEHKRSVRVAQGIVVSNTSFSIPLQTHKCIHSSLNSWKHTAKNMNQFFHNLEQRLQVNKKQLLFQMMKSNSLWRVWQINKLSLIHFRNLCYCFVGLENPYWKTFTIVNKPVKLTRIFLAYGKQTVCLAWQFAHGILWSTGMHLWSYGCIPMTCYSFR